jgi:acyl CoA:acetate/3-ketoacid CoA transferase
MRARDGHAKLVTADDAVALLRDGDTLANAGFVGNGTPDALLAALGRRFENTGGPRDLTLRPMDARLFSVAPMGLLPA